MTEILDLGDFRQWNLLKKLHENPTNNIKFGSFLKSNGFPHQAGKYYTQIRNKNLQILGFPADKRLMFIELNMSSLKEDVINDKVILLDINKEVVEERQEKQVQQEKSVQQEKPIPQVKLVHQVPVLMDIRQLPSVNRVKLLDILAGLPVEEKLKMISILKDLPLEEKCSFINILSEL